MALAAALEGFVTTAGLPGLVLGTMAEGETVAFLGGVLARRGFFPFDAAVLALALGAVVIDNLCFALGAFGRDTALARRLLAGQAAGRMRGLVTRHAVWAVLGFRFVWGMKTAGAVLFGASGLGWRRFVLLDAAGCLIWALAVAGLGYVTGGAIQGLWGQLALHWHLAAAGAVFLVGIVVVQRFLRRVD